LKTKNQTDTTTPTGNNGKTRLHKIRNQLKTRPPHTGVRNGPAIISTNQKTIGINKLGTLLSSQTTGHYSRAVPTKTPTGPQNRSGATFQTYPINRTFANQRFRDFRSKSRPHHHRHAQKRTIFQAVIKGGRPPQLSAPGCLTRGDSEDITRPQAPTQIHPHTTQNPANTRQTPPPKTQNQPKTTKTTFREAHHTKKRRHSPAL